MKKTLLSISILFNIGVDAQNPILTQANHAPKDGFSYVSLNCDTVNTLSLLQLNASNTGSTTPWNFTTLSVNTTTNAFTTSNYASATYTPANIIVASTNNTYSESNLAYLKLIAADAIIQGVSVTLTYTAPAVLANYPMVYSTNIVTPTSGTISPTGVFTGNCEVNYNAVGNLMLPNKNFANVARIKTIQSYTYNTPGFFNGNVRTESYDYYAIDLSRVPLLSISTSTVYHIQEFVLPLGSPADTTNDVFKFITILKDYEIVGINEAHKAKIQLSVFPNPATNLINFTTTSPEATKVIAYDVTGKIIGTELMESGKTKMNTSNIAPGVYIYNVLDKYNQVLKSGKFNVSK
jgi:hypothetical protein